MASIGESENNLDQAGEAEHLVSGDDPSAAATANKAPEHSPAEANDAVVTPNIPQQLPVVDVVDLDWNSLRIDDRAGTLRSRRSEIVPRLEELFGQPNGPGMLFDQCRTSGKDKVLQLTEFENSHALWFIGDLHGDLLALEAAIALIKRRSDREPDTSRIVFLGDLFDDEGFGLEVLLRIFDLICDHPARICILAGNHDEALSYDGRKFNSSVSPSDFSDFLNAHLDDDWIVRAGQLSIRLFVSAPRALFFPDGLLAAHGGFPLADLQVRLRSSGNWNDTDCLTDFVWTRAHPTARKKLPNRYTRGCQFGYEDFRDFCEFARSLGRPVSHMVRGHDHVEERFAFYPAYAAHPILTTVALSRRLSREFLGPYERAPTVGLYVEGCLPQVFRLHIPADLIQAAYPLSPEDRPDDPQSAGAKS